MGPAFPSDTEAQDVGLPERAGGCGGCSFGPIPSSGCRFPGRVWLGGPLSKSETGFPPITRFGLPPQDTPTQRLLLHGNSQTVTSAMPYVSRGYNPPQCKHTGESQSMV